MVSSGIEGIEGTVLARMGHHCCSKQKVKRGLWSPEEDEKLINYITTHGHGSWSSVPKFAGLQRCGKSCRLRWINYLRPDLKRGSFSAQEERIIIDVHRILGNRWAQIAKHLPGRTDNEVKNFWNSCIKKKLIAQGLDPNTHNLPSSQNIIGCNFSPKPTSVFSVNSQIKDASIGMNNICTPFSTLLSNIPPTDTAHSLLHDSSTIPTHHQHQNTNIVWKIQEQNPNALMESLNRSSMASVPIFPSSLNQSGFGIVDENCMWSGGLESIEPTRQEETLQPQQQEKASEVEIQKDKVLSRVQSMDASFGSCNFDFDYVESTLMPCGMYYNVSPTDQFAWDF